MSSPIQQALSSFIDPYLDTDWISSKSLKNDEGSEITIELGYPLSDPSTLAARAAAHIREHTGQEVTVNIRSRIQRHQSYGKGQSIRNVKNIIAIASGKGGVGKSTTAVNIALALHQQGARVGLLDADIYGPSQSIMMGIPEGSRPDTRDQQYFVPLENHGVQVMSMGFLVDEKTPMVWRGPMASGALQQLLFQTIWDNLDYLIIDMPPGTGDIQLTLSQSIPVTGSAIVTTPQDIALLDAKKGIEMFRKVGIPVLGVIENMSLHICSNCGHIDRIFGEGGGERIARQYQTRLLGSLPLDARIREQADAGTPTVVADPDSEHSRLYRDIALGLAAQLSLQATSSAIPNISMVDD